MTYDIFLALCGFAFVSTITPGPNNTMLVASGASFGYRRSLPHMFGISIGFPVMIAAVGLGLMQLFDAFPILDRVLRALSVAYLLWLAWKIASATPTPSGAPTAGAQPLTFLQSAGFQWVNPKAWSMATYAMVQYAADETGTRSATSVAIVALVFVVVSFPCISAWVALGQEMRRFLTSPARFRAFNWTMAVLLVATLYPVIWPDGWAAGPQF